MLTKKTKPTKEQARRKESFADFETDCFSLLKRIQQSWNTPEAQAARAAMEQFEATHDRVLLEDGTADYVPK